MINIVPNGVGAFGTAFKRFTEYVGHVSPHVQPDVIQKYAMLGTAHIPRHVLINSTDHEH
jgi:hypothetical protein